MGFTVLPRNIPENLGFCRFTLGNLLVFDWTSPSQVAGGPSPAALRWGAVGFWSPRDPRRKNGYGSNIGTPNSLLVKGKIHQDLWFLGVFFVTQNQMNQNRWCLGLHFFAHKICLVF